MGAPDPRTGGAAIVEKSAYDWEAEKKHWAYQPVKDPQPPAVKDPAWSRTAIDRFIKAKLDEKGLRPMAAAGKRELLRRVTYDLTGMPPTPHEVSGFRCRSHRRKRSRRWSIGCSRLRAMASTGDVTGSMSCATQTRRRCIGLSGTGDVPVSQLRHPLDTARQAVRPVPARADRRRPAAAQGRRGSRRET